MKVYCECGKCGKQWSESGQVINPKCLRCGSTEMARLNLTPRGAPDWFKPDEQERKS